MESELLTVAEAGERLGLEASHVRRLIRSGELQAQTIGARVKVVKRADVESYQLRRQAEAEERRGRRGRPLKV